MTMARILGTGSHLPDQVLDNQAFEEMGLETTAEWIEGRTGVR